MAIHEIVPKNKIKFFCGHHAGHEVNFTQQFSVAIRQFHATRTASPALRMGFSLSVLTS
jgi:hypothetical protein